MSDMPTAICNHCQNIFYCWQRLQQKMKWKGQNFNYFLKNEIPYFWEKRIFLSLCSFSVL